MKARFLTVALVFFLGLSLASEAEAKRPAPKNEDALIYQLEKFMKTPEGRKKLEALLKEQGDQQAKGEKAPPDKPVQKPADLIPPALIKKQQDADEKRYRAIEEKRNIDDWHQYVEKVKEQAAASREKCDTLALRAMNGKITKEQAQKACLQAEEDEQKARNLPNEEEMARLNADLAEAEADLAEVEAQIAALERLNPGITGMIPPKTPKIKELERIHDQKQKELVKAQKGWENAQEEYQAAYKDNLTGKVSDEALVKIRKKIDESEHALKVAIHGEKIAELKLKVARAEEIVPPFVPKSEKLSESPEEKPEEVKQAHKPVSKPVPAKSKTPELSDAELEDLIDALFKYDPGVKQP